MAQNNIKFHELNEQHGLSNTITNSIVQDTLGFVWVGTEDGLFRYNGSEFQAFHKQGLTQTIPNNTVNNLMVDSQNRVWILTNSGLGLYDYSNDRIKHFLSDENQLLPEEKVFTAITQRSDGIIYIGNSAGDIYTFKDNTFNLLHIANKSEGIGFNDLNISDFEMEDDLLWITTWYDGVFRLNTITLQIQQSLNNNNNEIEVSYIYDIFRDSKGNLWVGSDKGLQHVKYLGPKGFFIEDLRMPIKDEVLSIYQDTENKLWIGTRNNGLYKLKPDDNGNFEIEKHFLAGLTSNTISHRTISTIFQDRTGKIWLGMHSKGINVFDPKGEKVSHIEPPMSELISGGNITSVWGIAESEENGIWFATDGAGLYHYSKETEEAVKVASTTGPIVISDNAILSIAKTNDNKLWLGTYSSGINVIDLKTKTTIVFNTEMNSKGLQSNDIRTIHQDKENVIWIGTNRGGLHYYEPSKKSIIAIDNSTSLDIRGIVDDPVNEHILWLASYGDGLIKYNKKDGSIVKFNWSTKDKKDIPIALCLAYSDNRVWLGTKNSGLKSFDLKTQKFELLDFENELLSHTIRAIIPVGKHIWFSTNRGVSLLDVTTVKISNYNAIDGHKFSQFNDGSGLLTTSGNLAFGGIHGLNIFDPNEILKKRSLSDVTFRELSHNNKKVIPLEKEGILSKGMPIAKTLNFNPNSDIFSISFNVLDFNPSPVRSYAYLLEGYDKEWTIESQTGIATYRNVPPGEYTFKARVYDNSTEDLGPVSKIDINIAPSWWQTNWVHFGFTLMIIFILIIGYRYNRARITDKQKLFYEQKIRQQEYTTMEEKMRFYTNFSHELRTPITLILGPLNDVLNSGKLDIKEEKYLYFVKRNANTLLRLVNRLLDFRKIDTENIRLNLGHYDISILAKEEAQSFSFLAKERGIVFGFYSEIELMTWVDIEKIQIILNNLLANAFKFSNTGNKVTFKVYSETNHICFDIIDEGRGINQEELESIFQPFYQAKNSAGTGGSGLGLSLSKSLVEMHDGSLTVESEINTGSRFRVRLHKGRTHFEGQPNVQFIELQKGEISNGTMIEADSEEITIVQESSNQVILVVDDNMDIRNYVGSLFQDSFTVLYAENGEKALHIAKDVSPDIIISDLMMPEMNGHKLCRKLKQNITTSHIPILLLTAKTEKASKIEGFDEGADAYVTKPFDSEVLVARIHNLLNSREDLKKRFEKNKWKEAKNANSVELDFLNKVEVTVLAMIPTGNLNVLDLSKELGFSRTSLYRKIKSLTGLSINQLIRSIKLKRASHILVSEDMNVSEVAFSLDFTDLTYFRNVFKKQYGMMPSEYMKAHKSINVLDQEKIKKDMNL
jgi:signal transduction histidine kinase/ligand-binding sensor domain-containing protein/DNA-binding response OmpR family regulator